MQVYSNNGAETRLWTSRSFENPAFNILISWNAIIVKFVNTMTFFVREGVWCHIGFVYRQNIKEYNKHVSWKSCKIQSIEWRLRNSWIVSHFVCFIKCYAGVLRVWRLRMRWPSSVHWIRSCCGLNFCHFIVKLFFYLALKKKSCLFSPYAGLFFITFHLFGL